MAAAVNKPKSLKELKFGLEIELVGLNPSAVATVLGKLQGWESDNRSVLISPSSSGRWTVVSDGSIQGDIQARGAALLPRAKLLREYHIRNSRWDPDWPTCFIDARTTRPLTDEPTPRNAHNMPVGIADALYGRAELRTPPLRLENWPDVVQAVERLMEVGCCATTTCGGHIHVDVHHLDGDDLRRLFRIVYQHEDILVKALGVLASRLNGYAKKMDVMSNRQLVELIARKPPKKEDVALGFNHYHGLNLSALQEHGTVEFRYFNGTLDPVELRNNLDLALGIVRRAGIRLWKSGWYKEVFDSTCERTLMREFLDRLDMPEGKFPNVWERMLKPLKGDGPIPESLRSAARSAHRKMIQASPSIMAKKNARDELRKMWSSIKENWFTEFGKIPGCNCKECRMVQHLMQSGQIRNPEEGLEKFQSGLLKAA